VATGGIDAANAADFLAAGVVAVAVGSALTSSTLDEARARARAVTAQVRAAR
jgi:2-dehydro-3-deoxyphosphogluconate aldolase/(4S)-4-hydroxy-2-oxoglutarate aldolase